ncbi:MAG: hypothetical protein KJN98_02735, partial [Pontiella sp.]|nr:hypothetical protein [Pontiella sp.]
MLDTGTHVALIASWPAVIKTASVNKDLIEFSDFLPTICSVSGTAVPAELKVDGQSFAPQLKGERGEPREMVHC